MDWLIPIGVPLSVIPVAAAWSLAGPVCLRDQFMEDVSRRAGTRGAGAPVITDADLDTLPPLVRRYLRVSGVVGRPRPQAYWLTFTGRIRGGPDEAWMPFRAEQYSSVAEPARLFYMSARRSGVPIAVLHEYAGGQARMTVKLAGVLPIADARGPVMNRSETVTVFNDMCLLAPGTLVDPRITWRDVDDHSVDATFSAGGEAISARLTFGDDGMLRNFESDDRSRSSADGRTFTRLPFSTPVSEHGVFDGITIARRAEAQWRLPNGELFTYGEFTIESATIDAGLRNQESRIENREW